MAYMLNVLCLYFPENEKDEKEENKRKNENSLCKGEVYFYLFS